MSRRNSAAEKARRRQARHRQAEMDRLFRPAVPGDGSVFASAREQIGSGVREYGRDGAAERWGAASPSDEDFAKAYAFGFRDEFQDEAYAGAMSALSGNPDAGVP